MVPNRSIYHTKIDFIKVKKLKKNFLNSSPNLISFKISIKIVCKRKFFNLLLWNKLSISRNWVSNLEMEKLKSCVQNVFTEA